MANTDVIIVGAGPAGAMAALRLAKLGFSVVMLEKDVFPRIKTCGDLVTVEGLRLLQSAGLSAWMETCRRVDVLRFSAPDGNVLDIPVADPAAEARNRILPREFLDAKLAEAAVSAGAVLRDGAKVLEAVVEPAYGQVRVRTSAETITADMLLLADGSHAPVTRQLGLLKEPADLMAARQYLRCEDVDPLGPLEFHFQQQILSGYTWLFPQGSYGINLGCGTYTRRVSSKEIDLAQVLEDFKRHDPVIADRLKYAEPLGPVKAHPLRTHVGGTQTHAAHVLVLGDAAGLVSPFTGEGISSGMLSGALAARFVSDAFAAGDFSSARLAPYTQALVDRYQADHRAAYVLRSTLREPKLLNRFFCRMAADSNLAHVFADAYLDERSPRLLLHPHNLLKLLR